MPPTRTSHTAPPGPHYRELAPPADLAAVLSCVWTSRSGDTAPKRVVPDGCVDLLWMTDAAGSSLVVAGPDTRAHLTPLPPGSTIAAVRFAPGTARTALGVPLDAVRDERPELHALWGRSVAGRLADDLAATDRPELVLAAAVAARRTAPPDGLARHVANTLAAAPPPRPVAGLADAVGLSERQLHRRCLTAFGYGAKTLHRVLRFQAALASARQGSDLARVAHECGYADQAHLARDVAELAGTTMTDLLAG